ncbi:MAG: IS4 family transposase, partial [Thiobacillaceae bacterium]
YVLIAIVKKELQIDASLYSLLQILSVSVFEKTQLSQAFTGSVQFPEQTDLPNQLNLYDF